MARRARRGTTKRKSTGKRKPGTKRTASIPEGRRTVTPYIVVDGAARAIDFYKKAFGAKEINRETLPDGKLLHAEIQIGDSVIMMSDEFPGMDTQAPTSAAATTANLHITSKSVDELWNQAVNAGAQPTMPLDNMFWGERYGKLQDPFGHVWSVSQVIQMSEEEKAAKRQAALAMFEKGEEPRVEEEPSVEDSQI